MIAICSMVRNEARYLPEWLEFHRLQGINLFRIYDDGSTDSTSEFLAAQSDVDLVPWGGDDFMRQTTAFDHAAKAFSGYVSWCAFIDTDEFLFSADRSSLRETLAKFPEAVSAIGVQQRVFGSGEDGPEPVIQRFTTRAADDFYGHKWFKTIARPGRIIGFDSNRAAIVRGLYVLADGERFAAVDHPNQADRIASSPALYLNHYALKSWPEYQARQQRGAISDRDGSKRHSDEFFRSLASTASAVPDTTLLDTAALLYWRQPLETHI